MRKTYVTFLLICTINQILLCSIDNQLYQYSSLTNLLSENIDTTKNIVNLLLIEERNDTFFTLTYFEITNINLKKMLGKKNYNLISTAIPFKIKNKNVYVINKIECFIQKIPIQFCIENSENALKFNLHKNHYNDNIYTEEFEKLENIKNIPINSKIKFPKLKTYKDLGIKELSK